MKKEEGHVNEPMKKGLNNETVEKLLGHSIYSEYPVYNEPVWCPLILWRYFELCPCMFLFSGMQAKPEVKAHLVPQKQDRHAPCFAHFDQTHHNLPVVKMETRDARRWRSWQCWDISFGGKKPKKFNFYCCIKLPSVWKLSRDRKVESYLIRPRKKRWKLVLYHVFIWHQKWSYTFLAHLLGLWWLAILTMITKDPSVMAQWF